MSKRGEILQAAFNCCPSRNEGNKRFRGTIPHPDEALRLLRRTFLDQELIAAGVAKPGAWGELRIVPKLCQAGGAVLALRNSSEEPPFDLLTERGSVTGSRHPVLSAMGDGRRAALVEETGMILVAGRLEDVAWLDHYDIPATHGFGLSRLMLPEYRKIDGIYGEGLPRFMARESQADQDPEKTAEEKDHDGNGWKTPKLDDSPAFRPMLVLVDQLIHRRQNTLSLWLRNAAAQFSQIRRHAGIPFAGVWVFQPDDDFRERLKFGNKMRDGGLIRDVLLQSLTSLVDTESIVEPAVDRSDAAPDYLTARRDLIHQLDIHGGELDAESGRFADSLREYDSAVQAELEEPLVNWARKNPNPTVRAAGVQLAEVVSFLHQITPRLHALRSYQLREFPGGDKGSLDSSGLFKRYMQLLDRFSRLTGEIMRWMKT